MEQTNCHPREANTVAGAQGDPQAAVLLQLSHRVLPTGEAVASIGGELDIATAEMAVGYVRHLIDGHGGPVIVDLALLRFCDARGLSALLRMASDAEQAGCPFRLACPGRRLVRLMSITGLDRRFLAGYDQRRPDRVTGRIRLVRPGSGLETNQRMVLSQASSDVRSGAATITSGHGLCSTSASAGIGNGSLSAGSGPSA
jgi:anti-sigma B factor antagonist